MKLHLVGGLLVCAIVAAIAASGDGAAGPQPPSGNDELRRQLGALEKRVEALEDRLRRQAPPGSIVVPPVAPMAQPLPKGWQQREINGMPYYLVPALEAPSSSLPSAK